MSDLEDQYGFAAKLAKLTDEELVACLNKEIGNRGWGNARMYYTSCLKAELKSRNFDSSLVVSDGGLKLSRRVILANNRLEFA